jgi:mono/diheme cytochrome c family protein
MLAGSAGGGISMARTIVLCAALLGLAVLPLPATAAEPDLAHGQALVEANCSPCHAIGKTGDSPHAEAPLFRTLSKRYPIDTLEEALAEGIVTGHPDMPEFIATPDQIADIIGYLESIQED